MNHEFDHWLEPIRSQLTERIQQALHRAGLAAVVSIVADDPLALPSPRPATILGSRGAACMSALTVVLRPESGRPAQAHRWARELAGIGIVKAVVAERLPAHFGIRVAYMVPDRRGEWQLSDPPRFGMARFGRTLLEKTLMKKSSVRPSSSDAESLELVMDIHEVFGIPQEDPRFDDFRRLQQQRRRKRRTNGQLIEPQDIDQLEDRIAILERMLSKLTPQIQRLTRKLPSSAIEPSPILINPKGGMHDEDFDPQS